MPPGKEKERLKSTGSASGSKKSTQDANLHWGKCKSAVQSRLASCIYCSCRQIQEPVRHVRGSVSKGNASLGYDTITQCDGMRFVCPQCHCTLSSRHTNADII